MPLPQNKPAVVESRSATAWEDMGNPLHPMHRELQRRVGHPPAADKFSRPARLATLFYLGLTSWALLGGVAYLVVRLSGRV